MQEASWRVTEFETYNTLTHIKSNPVSIYIVSLLLLVSGWRHWSPPITTPSFTARKCFLCRWWNMMESKVSEAWSVCFAKRIHHKNHAKSLGTVLDSVCIGGRIGIHCRIAEWSVSEKWITSSVQINVFKLFAHWPVSNPDVASKSRRPIQLVREIMLESGSMCVPMVDLLKNNKYSKKNTINFLSSCSSFMWNVIKNSQTCPVQMFTFRSTKAPPLNIWVSHTMWLGYSCWQVNQARFQWEIQGMAEKWGFHWWSKCPSAVGLGSRCSIQGSGEVEVERISLDQ